MHSTARALVALNASASSTIGTAVPSRFAGSVSNATNRPSGEPCPANEMMITSSGCALVSRPTMPCLTCMWVAAASSNNRADRPSIVSVNSAQSAVASRLAPLSSGIVPSRCLLMPSYLYNGLEQRVLKTGPTSLVSTGTQAYVYDEASHLLGEYNNSLAVVQATVLLGDVPIIVLPQAVSGSPATTTTNVYNVYTDQIGAPRVITQASSRKMA